MVVTRGAGVGEAQCVEEVKRRTPGKQACGGERPAEGAGIGNNAVPLRFTRDAVGNVTSIF